jgi:hypothetical protein
MTKYKSQIYTGIWIPLAVILFFVLPYLISLGLFVQWVSWVVIGFGVIVFIYSFKWIDQEMFDIYFNEKELEIKYVFGKKVKIINYQDIIKFTFVETYKNSNNSFRTKDCHFIFNRVVGHERFIEFYKFLMSKNENIEIEILPLSSDLEFLRQQEFGLNYRKILKDTV